MAWDWKILAGRTAGLQAKYGQPLSGHTLFVIQHVLDDLYHLIESFQALGCAADDICVVGIPYSSRSDAGEQIRKLGCQVELPQIFPFDGCVCLHLLETLDKSIANNKPLIILEDGGYAVPLVSQLTAIGRVDPTKIKGAVEQTSRGGWVDEQLSRAGQLRIPVISIPHAMTKRTMEPPYIAEAIHRNLLSLLDVIDPDVGAKQVKVLGMYGFGSIGDKVARYFGNQASVIYVSDPMPERSYDAYVRAKFGRLTPARLEKCDLILGATGATSIGLEVFERVKDRAILGSTSSRQVEIDIELLRRRSESEETIGTAGPCVMQIPMARRFHYAIGGGSKSVTVLYDGYPINFAGRSLPDHVGDLILSLLLEGVVAVSRNPFHRPAVYKADTVLQEEDRELSMMFLEVKPEDGLNP